MEPAASADTPPTPMPRSPKIRGRWAVFAAALFSTFGALVALMGVRQRLTAPPGTRVDTFWFAGDVIRAVGFTLLVGLFVRYAFVIRWCNVYTERGFARWEAAHAALWRCVGVLLLLLMTQLAYIATRPAVQLPMEVREAQPQQTRE